MELIGPFGIAIAGIVVVVLLGLAALILRWRFSSRGEPRSESRSALLDDPRVEVLEMRTVDDGRQLVLIRCDDIEHLVMIGGPTDLVVENDVRKVRPPVAGATRAAPPAFSTAPYTPPRASAPFAADPFAVSSDPARVPPEVGASLDAAIAAATTSSRASAEHLRAPPQSAARSGSAPIGAASRAAAPLSPRETPAARPIASGPERRDGLQPSRTPLRAERAGESPRPATASTRPAPRGNGRPPADTPVNGGLPSAQVPWSATDSIEDDIVQALRAEPSMRGTPQAAPHRADTTGQHPVESSATLGDLADRLEEALAQEIQTAEPVARRKPAPAAAEKPAEKNLATEAARPKRAAMPMRGPDRREPAPKPAQEAEAKRETQPERREEAPVISLNARRREAGDPIEDEMARLLGELTGDSKGGR